MITLSKDGDSFIKLQHADKIVNNSGSNAIYGLGIIGAFIYYMQNAGGFWDVILGIIYSIFWPAVILYEVLQRLN